jgi:hypothetical protein
MDKQEIGWNPSRRDELITLARYGKVTPQEAEAEARASGSDPFEHQPVLPAFDPLQESRWTIVMAVAWIAWRDYRRVREHCPGFRSKCTHWIFREWNEPVEDGKAFAPRAGWFLETWHEATTVRLSLLETILTARDELPPTRQMTVGKAEEALWRALSDGHLIAEALNDHGKPVDIPAREWSYLKLFEDGGRDVLRYDALDRRDPFTDVKLRRDALVTLWPAVKTGPDREHTEWPITPAMLQPLTTAGTAGYVPLCATIQWIMTNSGTRPAMINEQGKWAAAVDALWPLICSGEIELLGLGRGRAFTEPLTPQSLPLVRLLTPLNEDISQILLNAPSHITCLSYVDESYWRDDFNDKLYESGNPGPAWTHLQVRKADVLSRWPRPSTVIKNEAECFRWLVGEMRQSPTARPKPKSAFWKEARTRFRSIGVRQFDRAWDKAVDESGARNWTKAGRPPKAKSNHRTK